MAKDNTNFDHTVASLFKGMDSFLTSRTVVGEPLTFGDTIIVPLVNVSFGVGAGAFSSDRANNGGGGMGGKMSPSAVLVIHNGTTRPSRVKRMDSSEVIPTRPFGKKRQR